MPILPLLTFEPRSEPCFLTSFPGWADHFSQTVRPASEEGGEVVSVPEEHRPTQPVKEVLWGLVSGSTSQQQQGPFMGAELRRQRAASQPALHPYTESILGPPCPTWFFCNSAASLLLKHSLLFTPKSPFTSVSPLFLIGPLFLTF